MKLNKQTDIKVSISNKKNKIKREEIWTIEILICIVDLEIYQEIFR